MDPLINILTRTSNRPNGFKININSVKNQTYNNIKHIIATDDINSHNYIIDNNIDNYIVINRDKLINNDDHVNYNTGKYSPHNLYFNEMHKYVSDGWVLYLDDDDRFYDNNSLSKIVKSINESDIDTIIYWNMEYSNGSTLPREISKTKPPELYNIGGSCFAFNYKYLKYASWDSWKCSDFRVINNLHNTIPKFKWINESLIFVPQSGLGNKTDIWLK